MNISHESLLITSAPAEILVVLAIAFCVSAVALFALAIEAGHYPALVRWFTLPRVAQGDAHSERCTEVSSPGWYAVMGGYEYDRAP